MKLLPQEVEVRFIIPTIRKEFALELIKLNYSQREIAKILEITPAAVNNYTKNKRGINVKLSDKNKEIIKESIEKISKNHECAYEELYSVSKQLIQDKSVCEIHRLFDDKVPKECEICLK